MASETVHVQLSYREIEVHLAQLHALACKIEHGLGDLCDEGKNPPDDAPLLEWRLVQVMKDMLESSDVAKGFLRLEGQLPMNG